MNDEITAINLCYEYCDIIKEFDKSYKIGSFCKQFDKTRRELHDDICRIYEVERGEISHLTNNLDIIDYDGRILHQTILRARSK